MKQETVQCPACCGSGRVESKVLIDLGVLVGIVDAVKKLPGFKLAIDPTSHLHAMWKRLRNPLAKAAKRSRVNEPAKVLRDRRGMVVRHGDGRPVSTVKR